MRTIEFSPPFLTDEDIKAVSDVLHSGWITTGSIGEEFSQSLKTYTKADSLILTNSATAALFIALKTMGIGEGDEVITSPYTFAATANVIYHTGAKVVFADLKKDSFYIDPKEIYKKLSPRTKAIIPVDFSSAHPISLDFQVLNAQYTPSNTFQEALNRPLILADSAHALGSRFLDPSVDMVAYSFHAVKNLTTAEGGALGVNSFGDAHLDQEYKKLLSASILHGQDRSAKDKFVSGSWEYDILVPGYKFNMPDLLAALGLSQLKRYESDILVKRRKITQLYIESLKVHSRVILDEKSLFHNVDKSSCHLLPLRILGFTEEQRNTLIGYCKSKGIATNVHYKPLTMMSVNKYYKADGEFPNAYAQYCNEISLPLHLGMSTEDVLYVCEIVKGGINEIGN